MSRNKTKLIDIHRDETGPGNRVGRVATGLYPEIDRHKLAKEIGCSASKVSYVLAGRFACKVEMAMALSQALRIGVEELVARLKEQQERWCRESSNGEHSWRNGIDPKHKKAGKSKGKLLNAWR